NPFAPSFSRRLHMEPDRTPLPPFITAEDAAREVRLAEDAWNSRDPERVSLACTSDSPSRNRPEFLRGREQIKAFLPANGTARLSPDHRQCGMRIGSSIRTASYAAASTTRR